MDMWPAYIRSVREHTEVLIAFDKFHVAQHLGTAVGKVRRSEPNPTTTRRRPAGEDALPVADTSGEHDAAATPGVHAVAPELVAGGVGVGARGTRDAAVDYRSRGWAERMWRRWYGWVIRSRLGPMKSLARMIKRHGDGVIDAVLTNVTNARSEATNAKIQWIERLGCGYRNRERFRNALYFHPGGLDLHPEGLVTHTNS